MRFIEYLRSAGYRKFEGAVSERVYRFFACPHPERGVWYVHKTSLSFQCLGCAMYCETDAAEDFQLFLPVAASQTESDPAKSP